jgi:hypothetical protein
MADQPTGDQRPRAEAYREIYINGAAVGGSGYDLAIIGLLTKQHPSGAGSINEEQVLLRTSPQQFKSLVGMMLEIIVSYERDFQILKLPAEQARREEMLNALRAQVLEYVGTDPIFVGASNGPSRRDAQSQPASKKKGTRRAPSRP